MNASSGKRRLKKNADAKTPSAALSADTATSEAAARKAAEEQLRTAHPWRVVEVAVVGGGTIWVAGSWIWTRPPDWLTVGVDEARQFELVLVAVGAGIWIGLSFLLAATPWGRSYVMEDAEEQLIQDNIESRMDSLTIAGLVFAGLAIAPEQLLETGGRGLLTLALTAFIVAWAAGFFPERLSSTLIWDSMHWTGLAALLGGVYSIGTSLQIGSSSAFVAITLATLVVDAYAAVHARAHLRGARPSAA